MQPQRRSYSKSFKAQVPAQVIDKGIPTAGLLAHVMIAKFADHFLTTAKPAISGFLPTLCDYAESHVPVP
jgi:hypothetical protein